MPEWSPSEPELWVVLESCTEPDCPCGDAEVVAEAIDAGNGVRDLFWCLHLRLVGGIHRSLAAAVAAYLEDEDDSHPFGPDDVRCLHTSECAAPGKDGCSYRGLVIGCAADRRVLQFERQRLRSAGRRPRRKPRPEPVGTV